MFERYKTMDELNIDKDREFEVVKQDVPWWFLKGEIVTLVRDDGTGCPSFKNKDWMRRYISLHNLTYHTPYKEGDVVMVRDEEDDTWLERIFICKSTVTEEYKYVTRDVHNKTAIESWAQIKPVEKVVEELTIEQVEKELGRKIKIVNENKWEK